MAKVMTDDEMITMSTTWDSADYWRERYRTGIYLSDVKIEELTAELARYRAFAVKVESRFEGSEWNYDIAEEARSLIAEAGGGDDGE